MAAHVKAFNEQSNALEVKLSVECSTPFARAAKLVDGMQTGPSLEVRILDKLKGRPGGLSLLELRDSLGIKVRVSFGGQPKPKIAFDQAVLSLYKERRVYLDRHDHPMRLTDAERRDLVSDGDGNYYVGITLRGDLD
jgi:hypothetical protein